MLELLGTFPVERKGSAWGWAVVTQDGFVISVSPPPRQSEWYKSNTPLCFHSSYVHIKDPLQYTELITRRSVPLTIAGIWATSALISLLPISLNMHAASTEEEEEERPAEEAGEGGGDGT